MNVKNYLVAAALLVVVHFSHPYPIKIANATDGEFVAIAHSAGQGVCEPRVTVLRKGQTRTLETGGVCCLVRMDFMKFSGSNVTTEPLRHSSTPPAKGPAMRCASISVTVSDAGNSIVSVYN